MEQYVLIYDIIINLCCVILIKNLIFGFLTGWCGLLEEHVLKEIYSNCRNPYNLLQFDATVQNISD